MRECHGVSPRMGLIFSGDTAFQGLASRRAGTTTLRLFEAEGRGRCGARLIVPFLAVSPARTSFAQPAAGATGTAKPR